jgi:hypothetical protein
VTQSMESQFHDRMFAPLGSLIRLQLYAMDFLDITANVRGFHRPPEVIPRVGGFERDL